MWLEKKLIPCRCYPSNCKLMTKLFSKLASHGYYNFAFLWTPSSKLLYEVLWRMTGAISLLLVPAEQILPAGTVRAMPSSDSALQPSSAAHQSPVSCVQSVREHEEKFERNIDIIIHNEIEIWVFLRNWSSSRIVSTLENDIEFSRHCFGPRRILFQAGRQSKSNSSPLTRGN